MTDKQEVDVVVSAHRVHLRISPEMNVNGGAVDQYLDQVIEEREGVAQEIETQPGVTVAERAWPQLQYLVHILKADNVHDRMFIYTMDVLDMDHVKAFEKEHDIKVLGVYRLL